MMRGPLKILVIGASGFIGRAVVDLMAARNIAGVGVSRRPANVSSGSVHLVAIPDYGSPLLIQVAARCDVAIMLAGRAHVLAEDEGSPHAAFMIANRDVALRAAEAFAAAGGRRFVFVSSIAVHGPAIAGQPLRESDTPAPVGDYGRSKWAGEQALKQRCGELDLELVIVRPPLVYGPAAPGNFGTLLRAAKRGLPLPLGSVHNRRDFIGIDNLADLLLRAAYHPAAAGQTFLASDGHSISTAAFVRGLYRAAGHRRRVIPVPTFLLRLAARLLRRSDMAERLLDDLLVDSSLASGTLGWKAPLTVEEGLNRSLGQFSS